jgi:predicted ArsR family transcriptional regulator
VLALIAEGLPNRAIADRLGISENGVKNHVSRLLAKFEVPTRAALVSAASRQTGGADQVSPADIVNLLADSLAEVLGTTATTVLMKRASKRAGINEWNPETPPVNMQMQTVNALVAALWPLLIETTGNIVVGRLQARGFDASGDAPGGLPA